MNPASTIICDVKIKGTLEFSESLFLDCQFEGDIISNGKLTIGEHGNVEGKIQADSLIIFGNVKGDIVIKDSCKIKSTATLHGDTKAQKLEISEGAIIQGSVTVPFQQEEAKSEPEDEPEILTPEEESESTDSAEDSPESETEESDAEEIPEENSESEEETQSK